MGQAASITNVNDAKLVQLISAASRRVLLLAPGVSELVAKAIALAWKRLGRDAVTVVVDVDPEVCRFGYGTLEALELLRDAAARSGALVCHQAGVRIGLLICDDSTLIYSPAPLLIEAGSNQPDRPNGIRLAAPPEQIVNDVGLGTNPASQRTVGLDAVPAGRIEQVAQDLKSNPPAKFDLARQVRVFTSRFQFVELEMTGCYVSRKRVPIPSSLVGLARTDEIQSQFHAHFNLINGTELTVKVGDRKVNERALAKRRQKIIKDFLIPLTGYGQAVLRANKDKLVAAVDELKADVQAFSAGLKDSLQKLMDANAAALAEALFPAVKANPPDAYTKFHGEGIEDGQLRQMLGEDLRDAFGQASNLIQDMKVSLIFKDVAYESLVDKKFLETARAAMPGVKSLHEEFDAARASAAAKAETIA
jgi:hypothetical protein